MRYSLLFMLILGFNISFAQEEEKTIEPHVLKSNAQIEGQYGERWYNQFAELSGFGLATPIGLATLYGMPIFPDSTIIVAQNNDGDVIYNYIHGAATVINPFHTLDEWLQPSGTVTLDSFAVDYSYTRNLDSNIVDTLFIYYIESHDLIDFFDLNNNNQNDVGEFTHQVLFSGSEGNLFPSSRLVSQGQFAVRYDQWSQVDTVLLTIEDSTTGGGINRLYRDLDIQVTPSNGGRLGAFLEFRPGYTWTTSDTLFDMNYFELVTVEQNGASTAPTDYFSPEFGGGSYVLRRQSLYNEYSGNLSYLNNQLEFTQAFGASWIYEHHFMWFKVSHPNVGLEDLDKGDFTVFPNPASDVINVAFSANSFLGNPVEIYSLEGKLVHSEITSDEIFQIDVSNWSPGMYIVRSGSNSKRLIIK